MPAKPSLWWLDLGDGRFAICCGMSAQQATDTAHRLGLGLVGNTETASPIPPTVQFPEDENMHDRVLPPDLATQIRALW